MKTIQEKCEEPEGYENEIITPLGNDSQDVYTGRISNLHYFNENPNDFGFSIYGDITIRRLSRKIVNKKKKKIKLFSLSIETKEIVQKIDKENWKIRVYNCHFYRTRYGLNGAIPLNMGKDEKRYIDRIREEFESYSSELNQNGKNPLENLLNQAKNIEYKKFSKNDELIRKIFNPIFKNIKYGELCLEY